MSLDNYLFQSYFEIFTSLIYAKRKIGYCVKFNQYDDIRLLQC